MCCFVNKLSIIYPAMLFVYDVNVKQETQVSSHGEKPAADLKVAVT